MQNLSREIIAASSKSSSLRALISSCLTRDKEEITIYNISHCDDVLAGIEVISSLRELTYSWNNNDLTLYFKQSTIKKRNSITLNVGESGFLARVMVSLASLFSSEVRIIGKGTLLTRDLGIRKFANKVGLRASSSSLPTIVKGNIQAGNFTLNERKSSQFLSGLLFTLPLLDGDSLISIENLVSKPYVELTLSYLERSGINFTRTNDYELFIAGNQHYNVSQIRPESDWSSLSFMIVLGIIGGDLTITNLIDAPTLPDRVILKLLDEIGGVYSFLDSETLLIKKSIIKGFSFDLTCNPDLAPVLVSLAISAESPSEFKNCYRLKDKESDRLNSIITMLEVLKIQYNYENDTLTIFPSELSGGLIKTFNDHRIAMSALILNAISSKKIEVDNYQCINKSYPNFLIDLKILGVEI